MGSSNGLFCPKNCPKPKDTILNIAHDREQQHVVTVRTNEHCLTGIAELWLLGSWFLKWTCSVEPNIQTGVSFLSLIKAYSMCMCACSR